MSHARTAGLLTLFVLGGLVACRDGANPAADLAAAPPDLAPPPDLARPRPTTCANGQQDGDESDVDCGGACAPCPAARACRLPGDCGSRVCGASMRCVAPATCLDGRRDGDESDIDCGGSVCGPCELDRFCDAPSDCDSHTCLSGRCGDPLCASGTCVSPLCSNGQKDEDEGDVDCGGRYCALCAPGKSCTDGAQCASGLCSAGACTTPSCSDGVRNGAETGRDCGAGCGPCPLGQGCKAAADCLSGSCLSGLCDLPLAPINLPGPAVGASSIASAPGVLYLTSLDWSVFASTDGGKTWLRKLDGGGAGLRAGHARIHVSAANPDEVLIYAFTDTQTSTYDNTIVVSHDGMASYTVRPDGISSWGDIMAFSAADAKIAYLFGDNGGSKVTTDAGASFTAITPTPSFAPWGGLVTMGSAAVSPTNGQVAWLTLAGSTGDPAFLAFDATAGTLADRSAAVAPALAGQRIGALEVYALGAGAWRLRLVGDLGAVAHSDDQAASFTSVGTSASLPPCGRWVGGTRQLVSSPTDRGQVATFCPKTTDLAFSLDGGASWTRYTSPSWIARACSVSGVALAGGRAFVTCQNGPPLTFPY